MANKIPTVFAESAFKHGIKERQIREVLANATSEEFDLGPDANGDPCEMLVGFDRKSNLLEIAICYEYSKEIGTGIRVFHAWKARKEWTERYNERKQNQGPE